MEAIANAYQSSDDDDDINNNNNNNQNKTKSKSVILAPNIDTSTVCILSFIFGERIINNNRKNKQCSKLEKYHDLDTKEILINPKANILFGPIEGPLRKYNKTREEEFKPKQTTLSGYVDIEHVDDLSFSEQYHTFQSFGYALNPSLNTNNNDKFIGNKELLKENESMTIFNQSNKIIKNKKLLHRKRIRNEDPSDIDGYLGPWAPNYNTIKEKEKYKNELEKRKQEWKLTQSLKKKRKLNNDNNDNNDDNEDDEEEEENIKQKRQQERKHSISLERTEFHGCDDELYDYQGRSYMYCPPERRRENNYLSSRKYYIPKKRIWQFIGHKKGVNAIKFIPKSGHLLLSASNDCTVKLWNIYDNRKCLRTFYGHSAGIRNICFNKKGNKFLTTSYDGWIKLYDVESGKIEWRGTSGILPFNAKFYPENENEFLCGQKNKLAVQWDMRYNKIIQKYDEHLSAVNDILFIDNNRRFVTTSDDKKIFIWDYGTPVVIKHISEPHLHSVPFLKLHPSKKWFLGQSMDNKIVSYSAINKIGRLNNKKLFTGHLCAGYSCQVDISYDGNIIMSGDANGNIYFWDWKTTKFKHKIQCHKKVTMGCIWHPVKNSLIATCSWDATISLWQ